MRESNSQTAAEATVNGAIHAARRIAVEPQASFEPISSAEASSSVSGGIQPYQGAAAIITNTNQILLVQHNRSKPNNGTGPTNNFFGYDPILNRDPIELPSGTRIVGIFRSTNGLPSMIAPPFAIRFDPSGRLEFGAPSRQDLNVYFDRDYDGDIDVNSSRRNGYDPDLPENQPFEEIRLGNGQELGRFGLPFDELQTVLGVAIFQDNGAISLVAPSGQTTLDDEAVRNILETARLIYFNRYTGAPVKVNQR